MKINIAGGRGLVGRIHQPIFENAGHEVIISGRKTSPNLEEAAKICDLTIVSVPINAARESIKIVAPYCTAIMDFTTTKILPVNAMLKYTSKDCEVGGLHPLYGDVSSIKGRTIIYCPTKRSGKKCEEIVKNLEQAGAKIKQMSPEQNDLLVAGFLQNARTRFLEAYGLLLKRTGLTIQELYEISPPPTRILLDLIARQVNEKNDKLYNDMRKFNPKDYEIKKQLENCIKEVLQNPVYNPRQIRELFGNELEKAQKRIKDLI
ncbi:prephenate dehydrogenase/arogenate dehydrogenase family protein [Candidatus Pacearchaeota archaeon]|nr:prephenate dehydrogenase/arogenate dehydrogenase family protein [Candidatus Pacearchaeota archaeon]